MRAEYVLDEQNSVMLNFSGHWGGSFWEPDQENVDVEGGEDGDGEGQEQGEDKGDPSVPVQTFAQAVLQSFWGGRGEVAEKIDVGGHLVLLFCWRRHRQCYTFQYKRG